MQRSKKIIITAHCILNQNTVIEDEARALGAIPSTVEWIMEEGFGVVQLPCPEYTFLGINRPPKTYEQYDNPQYRKHCREILAPIIEQLQEYQNNGYEIVGTIGIQSSPSCDQSRGVFFEEFQSLLQEKCIKTGKQYFLPNESQPIFNPLVHVKKTI
ncbi:CD3072 family TudS-related putative desulfidase [Schinkia sp. CFF1]